MFADYVAQVTATTGTGPYALGAADTANLPGARTFEAALGNGKSAGYVCYDGTGNVEVGFGTITTGLPATLSRTVLWSTNANSPVHWAIGTKKIRCVPIAELAVPLWVGATGGSAGALTATAQGPARAVYADGTRVVATITTNCATGATLSVGGGPALAIVKGLGVAIEAGDLEAGTVAEFVKLGSVWRWINGGRSQCTLCYRTGSTQSIAPTTWTTVLVNSVVYQVGGGLSLNGTTGQITVTGGGGGNTEYLVNFQVEVQGGSYTQLMTRFLIAGSPHFSTHNAVGLSAGASGIIGASFVVPLGAGSVVEFQAYHNNGGALNVSGANNFLIMTKIPR